MTRTRPSRGVMRTSISIDARGGYRLWDDSKRSRDEHHP
jgi:hypothetical protein